MNYWQAKKYFNIAVEFEKLTYEYWSKLPTQPYDEDGLIEFQHRDSKESLTIRSKISHLLPLIAEAANSLGVSYIAQSYPAPAVGGPIIPVNFFHSVIAPQMGHSPIDRKLIIDNIVRVKVRAQQECEKQLIHMLLPWNWIIDLCAFIIRIPFIILRRAGLPPKVEENIVSQVIKIIGTIILVTFLAYKGISLAGLDLVKLFKTG